MNRTSLRFGAALAVFLGLVSTACTSWAPTTVSPRSLIEAERPSAIRATLENGGQVVVAEPLVTADSVVSARGCQPIFTIYGVGGCEPGTSSVALGDIRTMEVRKPDPGVTAIGFGLPLVLLMVLVCNGTFGC